MRATDEWKVEPQNKLPRLLLDAESHTVRSADPGAASRRPHGTPNNEATTFYCIPVPNPLSPTLWGQTKFDQKMSNVLIALIVKTRVC